MQPILIAKLLILLMLANGTPLVAKKVLGGRFAWPGPACNRRCSSPRH